MTGLVIFIVIVAALSVVIVTATGWITFSPAWAIVAAFCCLLFFGGMTWWNWATTYQNDHWATCHVTDKDRGGDNGSYRVYTSDCGILANEDSTLRWKKNSADIWQKIPDEGVIELRIAGMRFRPTSQFPNIFDVREVETQN